MPIGTTTLMAIMTTALIRTLDREDNFSISAATKFEIVGA
jgi:hypothetical protein